MKEKTKNISRLTARPISGTARPVKIKKILPSGKVERECFLTQKICEKLDEFNTKEYSVYTNKDDSHGNHDTIIRLSNPDGIIGVQLTELTFEIERARQAVRKKYLEKILIELNHNKTFSKKNKFVKIQLPHSDSIKPNFVKPKIISKAISEIIDTSNSFEHKDFNLRIFEMDSADFYLPNINNIAIDVNFDLIPISFDLYKSYVDAIIQKKDSAKSDWLLIWSTQFWKDKHWAYEDLELYMKDKFKETKFKKVYFLESIDMLNMFDTNMTIRRIK